MGNGNISQTKGDTDHSSGNKQDKLHLDIELHDEKKKIKRWSSLKKPIWEWVNLLAVPLVISGCLAYGWQWYTHRQAIQRYQAELTENYIESVKELILDQYHHGKSAKYPEISVEEVEAFVRAKTADTLQALSIINTEFTKDQKQNIINFLSEAGIGFFPPYKYQNYYRDNFVQNICGLQKGNRKNRFLPQSKDITFHHFFCTINLSNSEVNLSGVNLRGVIWENADLYKAQLQGAILFQANLQGANLNDVNLRGAELIRANLKGANIKKTDLQKAKLNVANLKKANLSTRRDIKPENCDFTLISAKNEDCKFKYAEPTTLREAQLLGSNLQNAELTGVDFRHAQMSPFITWEDEQTTDIIIPTNLRNAVLEKADLRGTDLRLANLRGADLTDAKLDQAQLKGALYDEGTLDKFCKEKEDKTNNKNCDSSLNQVKREEFDRFAQKHGMIKIYQEADLRNKDLSYTDLREADLKKAKLQGAKLKRADLRGADLSEAEIDENTTFIDALYDEKTKLRNDFSKANLKDMVELRPEADLTNKDIRYVDLSDTKLNGAELQGARFNNIDFDEKTDLTDAQFDDQTTLPFSDDTAINYGMKYAPQLRVNWQGENHQKANLRGAILSYANFENAILAQAQLQKADLTDVDLKGTDLTDADLTGANLINADLTGANLTNADLKGADLTNADLKEANLTDADLRGVKGLDSYQKEQGDQKGSWPILCRTLLPNDAPPPLKQKAKEMTRECSKATQVLIIDKEELQILRGDD